MKRGMWYNGKRYIKGHWQYNWSSDSFSVVLDITDRITGMRRSFGVWNDTPEWGNWKKVTPETCPGHVGEKYCEWCDQKIDHISAVLNQML